MFLVYFKNIYGLFIRYFQSNNKYFQSGVKAKSLVAQALTNTNSNIFNVSGKKFYKTENVNFNAFRLRVLHQVVHLVPTRSRGVGWDPHPFPSLLVRPPSWGDLCLVSVWIPGGPLQTQAPSGSWTWVTPGGPGIPTDPWELQWHLN